MAFRRPGFNSDSPPDVLGQSPEDSGQDDSSLISDWEQRLLAIEEKERRRRAAIRSESRAFLAGDSSTSPGRAPSAKKFTVPERLSDVLIRAAAEAVDNGILVVEESGMEVFQSYRNLLERARCVAMGLRRAGVKPGEHLLLQLTSSRNMVIAFWSAVMGGYIPVLAPASRGFAHRFRRSQSLAVLWKELGCPAVLTSNGDSSAASLSLEDASARVFLLEDYREIPAIPVDRDPASAGLLSFAFADAQSGRWTVTTRSHAEIARDLTVCAQLRGTSAQTVSLNRYAVGEPVAFLCFHLFDTCCGHQQIHADPADISASPLTWLDLIDAHRVTDSWLTGEDLDTLTFWVRVCREKKWDLGSLQSIFIVPRGLSREIVHDFLSLTEDFALPGRVLRPVLFDLARGTPLCVSDGLLRTEGSSIDRMSSDEGRTRCSHWVDCGPPLPGIALRLLPVSGPSTKVTARRLEYSHAQGDGSRRRRWMVVGSRGKIESGEVRVHTVRRSPRSMRPGPLRPSDRAAAKEERSDTKVS